MQLSAKGKEAVHQALAETKADMDKLEAAADAAGATLGQFKSALETVKTRGLDVAAVITNGINASLRVTSTVLAATVTPLAGLATAGLATSAMGQVLTYNLGQLSAVMAGLFGPEIQKVINLVQNVTQWLRSLSDEQKTSIARWIAAGMAVLTVNRLMPMLVTGIAGAIQGVIGLTAAIGGLNIASGNIVPLISAIVTAAVALGAAFLIGTETGNEMLGMLREAFAPLVPMFLDVGKALMVEVMPALKELRNFMLEIMPLIQKLIQLMGVALVQQMKAFVAMVHIAVVQLRALAQLMAGIMGVRLNRALTHQLPNQGRDQAAPSGIGQYQGLSDAYFRIASQTIMATAGGIGRSVEEESRDFLEEIAENTRPRFDDNSRDPTPWLEEDW